MKLGRLKNGNRAADISVALSSPRCGAKTKQGTPCKAPATKCSGYKRCRKHGGAKGSGAPKGNKNALKHGQYSREMIERRREWQKMARALGY